MSEVTVMGLGEMGSAIARAFIDKGLKTTLWNRTKSKASNLIERGAIYAETPGQALKMSPVTVICLSSYEDTNHILKDLSPGELEGKTIIQLTSGIPSDVRKLSNLMDGFGAKYLDGAILAWPRQMGTDEAVICLSGSSQVLKGNEDTLKKLATLNYVGEDISKASALFSAVLGYLSYHWIGFCHGVRICESEGIDVSLYGKVISELAPVLGVDSVHMSKVISEGKFHNPESTLKTAGTDIIRLVDHAKDTGLSLEMAEFAARIFKRGIDQGHGAEEHAAIIKVMV